MTERCENAINTMARKESMRSDSRENAVEKCVPVMSLQMALTFRERLLGLLSTAHSDRSLVLVRCRSIHTYGMRYAIDVAFIDRGGKVVLSVRNLHQGQRLTCSAAVAVLERAADGSQPWFTKGQSVILAIGGAS